MNEMKYQMAFFLTAAFIISLASTSTTEAATETSTETVTETTSSAGATSAGGTTLAETTTTTEATTTSTRNISCHEYTCRYDGCVQNATTLNAMAICHTTGYCFGRLTYNSTYWKEELGCEGTTSGCLTTAHENNGGRRKCCYNSDRCNSIDGLKLQSTSSGLSYSLGVILSSLLLCFGKF